MNSEEFEICKNGCIKNCPIVNKKYDLCDHCNYFRLNGKTKEEIYKERASSKEKKIYTLKKSKPNQISEKQKSSNKQIRETYAEIALTREKRCTGCATYYNLSHSHILSRKQRPDLQVEESNITYHCLSIGEKEGCHQKWESQNYFKVIELADYLDLMQYVKDNDKEIYNKLIIKFEVQRTGKL